MNIPANTLSGFLGAIALVIGIYLALAGLRVMQIPQINVTPGPRTWITGIVLAIVGAILVFPEIRISPQLPSTVSPGASNPTSIAPVQAVATTNLPTTLPKTTDVPTDTPAPPSDTPILPTATPTTLQTSVTQTASPPGSPILYQADWSTGLNGWFGSQDWKTLDGMLINDGTHNGIGLSITAPYTPNTDDYAVEAEIQVIRPIGCSSFGIVARADRKETGYQTGINYCEFHGAAFYYMPELGYKEFEPGTDWHTYRLEVKGNTIKFLIDGALVLKTSDNRYLSGGQVGLWNDEVQLNVRSFKVMKLDH